MFADFSVILKALRTATRLSQKAFGERIGVSIDVIKNFEYGKTSPSDVFLNHLCNVYNVNREWLETGEGDPLLAAAPDPLDEIARANHLTPLERGIIQGYLGLSPDQRAVFAQCLRTLSDSGAAAAAAAPIDRITAQLNAETADDPPERSEQI